LRYDIAKRAAEFKQRKAAKPEQDLIRRFQA
jgi:hypothetical protein